MFNDLWFSPFISQIRREWEPGIRVRRKLNSNHISKEGSGGNGVVVVGDIQSSSLLSRSRSNSHSGKKEPKSGGEGNGSVIQDSGFSTETSSSKEAHSASSTAGSAGVQVSCDCIACIATQCRRRSDQLNSSCKMSARVMLNVDVILLTEKKTHLQSFNRAITFQVH